MTDRTCDVCGKALPAHAHHRRRFCDRTCERASYKVKVPCSHCGEPTLKDRYDQRWGKPYCSFECRDSHRHGSDRVRARDLPTIRRRQRAVNALQRAAAGTHGSATWVAGRCAWCQSSFVFNQSGATTCSRRCLKRFHRRISEAKRRAVARGAESESINPRRVFDRDGWRCGICGRRTSPLMVVPHPRAPTLDHIVPLARGGTHTYANVQCACFMCNALKGDGSRGPEQLRLIG